MAGSGRAAMAAAILGVLTGCASDEYDPDRDPAIQKDVRARIEAMETLRGADLVADIEFLGGVVRRPAVPALRESLSAHRSARVRAGCAQALGRGQDPRAVPALWRAAEHDPNAGVRLTAGYNLCLFRDARGLGVLVGGLSSDDSTHRKDAHDGLRSLTGKDFGYDPMGDPPDRATAAARWSAWLRETGFEGAAMALRLPR